MDDLIYPFVEEFVTDELVLIEENWELDEYERRRLKKDDDEIHYKMISKNELEERIINRFAAELLMPTNEFKKSYYAYIEKLSLAVNKFKVIDLLRIVVFLMNDYMVPYESVRRRLIETDIIHSETGKLLLDNETTILPIINALSKDQNTMLDRVTAKKTIPGLRNLLEKAEETGKLSLYTLAKIKKDFDIDEINEVDAIMEVTINGGNYEENWGCGRHMFSSKIIFRG